MNNPYGYVLNHTMVRVKDLDASLCFYQNILGFSEIYREDFNSDKFTIVYLAYMDIASIPVNKEQRRLHALSQPGVLELTYNYGTEKHEDFKYHNGNSEPQGFGHICITVPDLEAACARMLSAGVRFQKKTEEGRMNYVAFILDPDDYWIEILQY